MRHILTALFSLFLVVRPSSAASKVHTITFGKLMTVQWFTGPDERESVTTKIRGLYLDQRLREFVLGPPHEITERLFVVQRIFRINDGLPQEKTASPRWQWEPGGWLLVDRFTGRISPLSLPEFDPFYSTASWYRDYVAYCGVSDDGKKAYAVVTQVGRRKPMLKKPLTDLRSQETPGAECAAPGWQRGPIRVTFAAPGDPEFVYAVRGHVVDMVSDAEDNQEGTQ